MAKVNFKGVENLPTLAASDVKKLVKFLQENSLTLYYAQEEYHDYCCSDEGVEDGYSCAVNTLKLAYNLIKEEELFSER